MPPLSPSSGTGAEIFPARSRICVLARSGTVHVVAAGLCFHTGRTWERWQSNGNAVGIEAEATGHDVWSAAQYAAYARL